MRLDQLHGLADEPLTQEQHDYFAAMPSHELYFWDRKYPSGTVRQREIRALYLACLDREFCPGKHDEQIPLDSLPWKPKGS